MFFHISVADPNLYHVHHVLSPLCRRSFPVLGPLKNIALPAYELRPAGLRFLIARRAQRTPVYASPSSRLAALLDGLFEQSLLFGVLGLGVMI
jgi:hypothetical protein